MPAVPIKKSLLAVSVDVDRLLGTVNVCWLPKVIVIVWPPTKFWLLAVVDNSTNCNVPLLFVYNSLMFQRWNAACAVGAMISELTTTAAHKAKRRIK